MLFDIDGVFVDSKEYTFRLEGDIIEQAGYPRPSRRALLRTMHIPLLDLIRIHTKASEGEVRRIYGLYLSGKVKPHMELIKFDRKARGAIRTLSRSYLLGLVTNRTKLGVKRFYKLSGLRRYFKTVVAFGDYERPKPYPEPLLLAAHRLRISPGEAIYVGDADIDLKAAKAAGMPFLLYSKKKNRNAEYVVDSFSKLPSTIRRISRTQS